MNRSSCTTLLLPNSANGNIGNAMKQNKSGVDNNTIMNQPTTSATTTHMPRRATLPPIETQPSMYKSRTESLSCANDSEENEIFYSPASSSSFLYTHPQLSSTQNEVESASLLPSDDLTTQNESDEFPNRFGKSKEEDSAINDDQLKSMLERQCRYCHAVNPSTGLTGDCKKPKPMIAPCRCAGSVKFVHTACLTRWIEVSTQKMYPTPRCELCGYKYRRRPFIDLTRLHLPYVECCDKILNSLFVVLIIIMIACGWVAVHYLRLSERRPMMRPSRTNNKRFLTENDVTVIIASILFFAAFFIALFTQYRAEVTVFRVMARMWTTNRNWRIRNYDIQEDLTRKAEQEQAAHLKSVPKSSGSMA
ncbi:RING-variant domain-containing protein [Ditylenchus destructor]|uniref:RING-variant domain-containing protein n=1 Tax=Ditylenchus destructor TaxID=166010 RepID=A0AAD4RB07_9BILA|nr:RING-variant domain-containing protein [Ditylenchus destructor]